MTTEEETSQDEIIDTEVQAKRGIKVKFEVSADESLLLDRLIDTYLASNRGKMVLLKESACGGFALKESGLLDLVMAIAERKDYVEADSFGRSQIMTSSLREILSPAPQFAFIQPPAAIETKVKPARPVTRRHREPVQEVQEAQEVEPTPVKVKMDDLSGMAEMGS